MAERSSSKTTERPGYARVSAFGKVWDHITKLRLDRVDQRTLSVVGVRGTAANECMAALRFLGVVSEDGAVSEGYAAVREGNAESVGAMIDAAYSGLLRICPMPAESRAQLEKAMIAAYDLREGRMAMAAAALFAWLYEQAGRSAVKGAPPSGQADIGPKGAGSPRERLSMLPSRAPGPAPIVLAISIGPQTTAAEIQKMIAQAEAAWHAGHSATTTGDQGDDKRRSTFA